MPNPVYSGGSSQSVVSGGAVPLWRKLSNAYLLALRRWLSLTDDASALPRGGSENQSSGGPILPHITPESVRRLTNDQLAAATLRLQPTATTPTSPGWELVAGENMARTGRAARAREEAEKADHLRRMSQPSEPAVTTITLTDKDIIGAMGGRLPTTREGLEAAKRIALQRNHEYQSLLERARLAGNNSSVPVPAYGGAVIKETLSTEDPAMRSALQKTRLQPHRYLKQAMDVILPSPGVSSFGSLPSSVELANKERNPYIPDSRALSRQELAARLRAGYNPVAVALAEKMPDMIKSGDLSNPVVAGAFGVEPVKPQNIDEVIAGLLRSPNLEDRQYGERLLSLLKSPNERTDDTSFKRQQLEATVRNSLITNRRNEMMALATRIDQLRANETATSDPATKLQIRKEIALLQQKLKKIEDDIATEEAALRSMLNPDNPIIDPVQALPSSQPQDTASDGISSNIQSDSEPTSIADDDLPGIMPPHSSDVSSSASSSNTKVLSGDQASVPVTNEDQQKSAKTSDGSQSQPAQRQKQQPNTSSKAPQLVKINLLSVKPQELQYLRGLPTKKLFADESKLTEKISGTPDELAQSWLVRDVYAKDPKTVLSSLLIMAKQDAVDYGAASATLDDSLPISGQNASLPIAGMKVVVPFIVDVVVDNNTSPKDSSGGNFRAGELKADLDNVYLYDDRINAFWRVVFPKNGGSVQVLPVQRGSPDFMAAMASLNLRNNKAAVVRELDSDGKQVGYRLTRFDKTGILGWRQYPVTQRFSPDQYENLLKLLAVQNIESPSNTAPPAVAGPAAAQPQPIVKPVLQGIFSNPDHVEGWLQKLQKPQSAKR